MGSANKGLKKNLGKASGKIKSEFWSSAEFPVLMNELKLNCILECNLSRFTSYGSLGIDIVRDLKFVPISGNRQRELIVLIGIHCLSFSV